jgi:hypothetical protein
MIKLRIRSSETGVLAVLHFIMSKTGAFHSDCKTPQNQQKEEGGTKKEKGEENH